jgi:hypothetical protein
MFRKDGFLNFSQLINFSIEKSKQRFPAEGEGKVSDYIHACRVFSAAYTLRHILEAVDSIYVLGSTGEAVELDAEIFLEDERLFEIDLDLAEPTTIAKVTAAYGRINPSIPFVDMDLGIVSVSNCFLQRLIFWKSPSARAEEIRRRLRPFDGYAIAVSKKDVDAVWSLIQELEIKNDARNQTSGASGVSGLEDALRCFYQAFPHGKNEATWETVQSRTGYSRRTINRALQKYGHQKHGQ